MQSVNRTAAIKAGLIAGVIFLVLELALVAASGDSIWGPVRMIGAIALGANVLPPPATFDATALVAALAVHFALAILYGAIFAVIAATLRLGLASAAIVGLVFGLAVYAVNFYGMTAFFPWFAMARNGISIFAHAMFGLALGYSYRKLAPAAILA